MQRERVRIKSLDLSDDSTGVIEPPEIEQGHGASNEERQLPPVVSLSGSCIKDREALLGSLYVPQINKHDLCMIRVQPPRPFDKNIGTAAVAREIRGRRRPCQKPCPVPSRQVSSALKCNGGYIPQGVAVCDIPHRRPRTVAAVSKPRLRIKDQPANDRPRIADIAQCVFKSRHHGSFLCNQSL